MAKRITKTDIAAVLAELPVFNAQPVTQATLIERLAELDVFETKASVKPVVELIVELGLLSGVKSSTKEAGVAIDTVLETISSNVIAGNNVYLGTQFGEFKTYERAAREGHNPATGEKLQIPAKNAVKFTPSGPLKAAVAGA